MQCKMLGVVARHRRHLVAQAEAQLHMLMEAKGRAPRRREA